MQHQIPRAKSAPVTPRRADDPVARASWRPVATGKWGEWSIARDWEMSHFGAIGHHLIVAIK